MHKRRVRFETDTGAVAANASPLARGDEERDGPKVDAPIKSVVQFRYVVGAEDESHIVENAPVSDISNSSDSRYMGTWVAEVALAHPNGDIIRKYQGEQSRLEQVRNTEMVVCLHLS